MRRVALNPIEYGSADWPRIKLNRRSTPGFPDKLLLTSSPGLLRIPPVSRVFEAIRFMLPQIQPLDVEGVPAGWRDVSRVNRCVWGFVALGVVIRVVGYLLRFPLWVDECMLAENLLDRGFLDLLMPLDNHQMAPVGFLWIELLSVKLLGFSEYSLRLFPLACGIASLFVFRHLAARVLRGLPLVLAVACLAVAKAPQGLSANVKPYASDLLVAALLVALAVEWLRRPERAGWLWGLCIAAPLAVFLSYPAFFVALAAAIALFPRVCRQRNRKTWLAYVSLQAALALSLAGVLGLNSGLQAEATRAFMLDYWTIREGFPPAEPLRFVSWLFEVHLGDRIFAVPYAAENGGGLLAFGCCLAGAVTMYRRRQRTLLALILATFAVTFAAAVAGRYPYGGHNRLMQFLVPGIAILCGLGGATLLAKIARPELRRGSATALVVALATFGAGLSLRDVMRPYHFVDDAHHREFARQFWADEPETLTLCSLTDLGQRSYPGGWYAYYRCNQKIYSRRHHAGEPLSLQELEHRDCPVRLVIYHPPHQDLELQEVADCLKLFEPAFEPSTHHCLKPYQGTADFDMYGSYETFRLVPRPQLARSEHASMTDRQHAGRGLE